MNRRNLLRNIILFIFAFIFGYTIKKDGETTVLQRGNSPLFTGKGGESLIDEISIIKEQSENTRFDLCQRGINIMHPPAPFSAAKGDGIYDDTTFIQNILDFAAKNKMFVIFPNKTFSISTVKLNDGIKGCLSYGATIKANTVRAGEALFHSSLGVKINDCIIDGFTFDCNGLSRRAIFIAGTRNKISNNKIIGLNNSSNSEQGIRIYHDSSYNLIENNHIFMTEDRPFGTYSSLIGIHISGKHINAYAGLDTSEEVIQPTKICFNNIVTNNFIEGGTHGISIMASERNVINNNIVRKNSHRNIILSPNSSYNQISGNSCIDFGSSGIHLAYGSSYNNIVGNNVYSSKKNQLHKGEGESAIQCYVHSKYNNIANNRVYSNSNYGIYTAIHCNGINIQGNYIEGGKKASICLESDWVTTLSDSEKYARPNFKPPTNPSWTSWDNGKGFKNIIILNNSIQKLSSESGCGIYIGQSSNSLLASLTISGNVINSPNISNEDLYVYVKDKTKFLDNVISENKVTRAEPVHIIFTNEETTLLSYCNNSWQNSLQYITAINNNTISVAKSNLVSLPSYAVVDTITGHLSDSNNTGREITLRLNTGVVVKHNRAKIQLKGDDDIIAININQFIRLIYISGIWYETSRNF